MDGEAANMNAKQQDDLIYAGTCLFMILLSAAGIAYGVMTEMILAPDALFTLDGILLALICLTLGGLFTVMLAWHAIAQGWIKFGKKSAPAEPPSDAK